MNRIERRDVPHDDTEHDEVNCPQCQRDIEAMTATSSVCKTCNGTRIIVTGGAFTKVCPDCNGTGQQPGVCQHDLLEPNCTVVVADADPFVGHCPVCDVTWTTRAPGTGQQPAQPEARDWLIRKSGYFYRPDRAGYTSSAHEAGRYTEAEAKAEATVEAYITAHHISEYGAQPESGEARHPAIENLRNCQRQLDMDGCEVGVSRQAVDETLAEIDRLQSALAAAQRSADDRNAMLNALKEHVADYESIRRQLTAAQQRIATMRAKLLELAGECAECAGSGSVMSKRGVIEHVPCPDCLDIREAAGVKFGEDGE